MPRGGKRPNAGRKFGIPNKATIERQEQARIDAEIAAAEASGDVAKKKLAKDVLEEFMLRFSEMAAYHQPARTWHEEKRGGQVVRVNDNPNTDEGKFRAYAALATQAARDLAQYQSPKLSAVAVGAVTRMTVHVLGGLPPMQVEQTALPAPAADPESGAK